MTGHRLVEGGAFGIEDLGAGTAGRKGDRRAAGEGRGMAGGNRHQAAITADPHDFTGGDVGEGVCAPPPRQRPKSPLAPA